MDEKPKQFSIGVLLLVTTAVAVLAALLRSSLGLAILMLVSAGICFVFIRLAHDQRCRVMIIRLAQPKDTARIWEMIAPAIRAGETLAMPHDMSEADALAYWMGADRETFVAEEEGRLLGTYYLRANQLGGGSHVANGGYITAPEATG